MLKYKSGASYVPANEVGVERYDCPVKVGSSDNGGFMKVINGVWAVTRMFAMMIVNNHTLEVIYINPTADAGTHSFSLPAEANVSISNHTLVRS